MTIAVLLCSAVHYSLKTRGCCTPAPEPEGRHG